MALKYGAFVLPFKGMFLLDPVTSTQVGDAVRSFAAGIGQHTLFAVARRPESGPS